MIKQKLSYIPEIIACVSLKALVTDKRQDFNQIILRYVGSKCRDLNIKSCISPDGQYLLCGSESGTPYIWDISTGLEVNTGIYSYMVKQSVMAVDWNPTYNMVAMAGYGSAYPILVYVYEREPEELIQYGFLEEADNKQSKVCL